MSEGLALAGKNGRLASPLARSCQAPLRPWAPRKILRRGHGRQPHLARGFQSHLTRGFQPHLARGCTERPADATRACETRPVRTSHISGGWRVWHSPPCMTSDCMQRQRPWQHFGHRHPKKQLRPVLGSRSSACTTKSRAADVPAGANIPQMNRKEGPPNARVPHASGQRVYLPSGDSPASPPTAVTRESLLPPVTRESLLPPATREPLLPPATREAGPSAINRRPLLGLIVLSLGWAQSLALWGTGASASAASAPSSDIVPAANAGPPFPPLPNGGSPLPPSVANDGSPLPPFDKLLESPAGFTLQFPDGFVVAVNRRSGQDVLPDGSETLAVIGNFATIDTVSIRTIPYTDASPPSTAAEIADKVVLGGNVATELVSQGEGGGGGDSNPGNQYSFEYVTLTCRGQLVEGLGGVKECVSGDRELIVVRRHHLALAVLDKGVLYIVTGSCADERWGEASPLLQGIISSFRLSDVK